MRRPSDDEHDGGPLLRDAALGRLVSDLAARRRRGTLLPGEIRQAADRRIERVGAAAGLTLTPELRGAYLRLICRLS